MQTRVHLRARAGRRGQLGSPAPCWEVGLAHFMDEQGNTQGGRGVCPSRTGNITCRALWKMKTQASCSKMIQKSKVETAERCSKLRPGPQVLMQALAPGHIPYTGPTGTRSSVLLRTLQRQPGRPLERGRGTSGCWPGWVLRGHRLRQEPGRLHAGWASRPRAQPGAQGSAVCETGSDSLQLLASNQKVTGLTLGSWEVSSGVLGGQLRCPGGRLCHLKRDRKRQGGERADDDSAVMSGLPACLMPSPRWPCVSAGPGFSAPAG